MFDSFLLLRVELFLLLLQLGFLEGQGCCLVDSAASFLVLLALPSLVFGLLVIDRSWLLDDVGLVELGVLQDLVEHLLAGLVPNVQLAGSTACIADCRQLFLLGLVSKLGIAALAASDPSLNESTYMHMLVQVKASLTCQARHGAALL